MRKPKPRWAMPVSLQRRAPMVCTVVDPKRKRPVPQSALGSHVRPRRLYQVQLVSQGSEHEPDRITLDAPSSLRCVPGVGEVTSMDGRAIHWLNFEPVHNDTWPWYLRSLFSRIETITVRQQYSDGRDDYDHCLSLVITPTRTWVLWSLLSVATLYLVSAVINQMLKADADLPSLITHLHDLSRMPLLWVGMSSLVMVPWLLITLLDRVKLWAYWQRERRHGTAESGSE
jgi:hypothetical protein